MIQLTEKDLKYIIKESINKVILNESMTDIAYHFTNYGGLIGILSSNSFNLSSIDNTCDTFKANDNKKYYLSFTRQKYGNTGYPKTKPDSLVRITINGRLLNNQYKSVPYDYYARKEKSSSISIEMNHNGGKLPYEQDRIESEDRLLSNSPTIPDALKYIERIDIFIENFFPFDKKILFDNKIKNKIFVYLNKKDFNIQSNKYKSINEVYTVTEYIQKKIKEKNDINDIFDEVIELNNNLAKVKINYYWNIIDKKGNILFPNIWFNFIGKFKDGFINVIANNKSNLISEDGKILYGDINNTNTWFDCCKGFYNGISQVALNFKFNLINTEGKILFGNQHDSNTWFDSIYENYNGFYEAEKDNKIYYFDIYGKLYDKNPMKL